MRGEILQKKHLLLPELLINGSIAFTVKDNNFVFLFTLIDSNKISKVN
jgi:hypothetical protein